MESDVSKAMISLSSAAVLVPDELLLPHPAASKAVTAMHKAPVASLLLSIAKTV